MILPEVALSGDPLPKPVWLLVVDEEVIVSFKVVSVPGEAGFLVSGCPVVSIL